MKIRVNEVFYSVQGEGVLQGVPTTFVRLQGCNLLTPCSWCDTSYAQSEKAGFLLDVDEVLGQCVKLEGRTYQHWVCVTGGEPLFQLEALHELVKGLHRYGFRIEVETNGSIPKPYWWTVVDSWVADIKCPSSGVCGVSLVEWFDTRATDQIKFVVANSEDLDFTRSMIRKFIHKNPVVLVSPATGILVDERRGQIEEYWNRDWLQEVIEFCKEMKVRFSLQIHKVAYGNRVGV